MTFGTPRRRPRDARAAALPGRADAPGDGRAPTLEDVAAAAEVSTATVSRALRGVPHVNPRTRERVRAAAEALHYVASPTASGLASGRSRLVGVLAPDLGWSSAAVLAAGDEVLRARGYHVLLVLLDGSPEERLARTSGTLPRVDGLLLLDVGLALEEAALVRRRRLPVVTVGDRFGDAPWVGVDDVHATRLATEHLLDLGHERLAYLGAAPAAEAPRRSAADRLAGFRRAVHEREVRLREEWVLPCDWTASDASAVAAELLRGQDRPSAVCAASDEIAVGVLGAAGDLGLRVPEDLSVVGVGDHDVTEPLRLTTVRLDAAGQGNAAARALLGLLEGPGEPAGGLLLPVTLVARGSTAPPRPERSGTRRAGPGVRRRSAPAAANPRTR